VPDNAAVERICSRSGFDLNLSAATAHLRVDGRQDQAHLADHIGIQLSRPGQTRRPPPPAYGNPITLDIDVPGSHAGKLRVVCSESGILRHLHAGHYTDEIEYVVADQRQVEDPLLVEYVADRRTRLHKKLLSGNADLHRLRR